MIFFESLNDWNIITFVATSKNKPEKDDDIFGTILRRAETRMCENILSTIYSAMRVDDESTDGYYGTQWTSEPYTLQEDKEMKSYTQLVTTCVGEIVCDVVF